MPQYSLLGGLGLDDPSYMPGVSNTPTGPFIHPITGQLIDAQGNPYTGERPLQTPPILPGKAYQPDIVPESPTPPQIEERFNQYAKPDYSPGKIAQLVLTSPLRFLSGLDQELKGALGIPTIQDTADYGRMHYGGETEPSGPFDRLIGAMTGSSRDQERATLQTSHDVLRQMALRKQAIDTNAKLQKLFSGAYDLYGKPTTIEKGERELQKERIFGLPTAALDYGTKSLNYDILQKLGMKKAIQDYNLGSQNLDIGEQTLGLNDLERRIKSIKLRADLGDEQAKQLYDYLLNHPNPEIKNAVRAFTGATAKLLENEPLTPGEADLVREGVQKGITAQSGSLANLNTAANPRNPVTGRLQSEETAAAEKTKDDEIKRQFDELKFQLEKLGKTQEEQRAGYDDIATEFDKVIPPESAATGQKNAPFRDLLHGIAPKMADPSLATQRTALLARKGEVLALYQKGSLTKEQATLLANNPTLKIEDLLPGYSAAMGEVRAGPTPTPRPTESMDAVIPEDTRPTPRATPDLLRQPSEETRQREADTKEAWTQRYNAEWARREGRDAPQTGARYEAGKKAYLKKFAGIE